MTSWLVSPSSSSSLSSQGSVLPSSTPLYNNKKTISHTPTATKPAYWAAKDIHFLYVSSKNGYLSAVVLCPRGLNCVPPRSLLPVPFHRPALVDNSAQLKCDKKFKKVKLRPTCSSFPSTTPTYPALINTG